MEITRIRKIIFSITFLLGFFVFALPGAQSATIRKPANNLGLLGYWSFNEGTSTVATDFSGRGNNGTMNTFSAPATPTSGWGSGKIGAGLKFDGSSDYVDLGNPSALRPTSNTITITAWVKPSNTGGGNGYIVSKETSTADYFMRQQGTSGALRCSFEGTGAGDTAVGTLVDGEWAFIACVFDGTNTIVYKNGISILSAAGTPTFSDNGDSVNIGRKGDGTAFFPGTIDEVRIYNRGLGPTEILGLYSSGAVLVNSANSQKNIVTNGLIGYWTMDGGNMTSSLAYDSSTSGNTLNMLNGPTKTVGKVGQSLNMDALDDELYCTDANCGGTTGGKYDMGTRDWTAMAWVKPEAGGTNCNIRGTVVGKIGDDEIGWYLGIGGQFICSEIRGAVNVSSTSDGSTVPLNEWSHIAVVFDRDGNMTRYLNGVQTGTQDSIASNDGSSVDHPHNFCIGGRDGAGGCVERLFDGSIDEVRVYERVLTATEIKQVYNASAGSKINASQNVISGSGLNSGLVGLWSFNGPDVTDKVYDRSGQGNDGYHNGRATSTAKTSGKIGQAFDFDGTTDFVHVGSPSVLNDLGPLTYSVWIYPRTAGGGGRGHIISKTDTGGASTGGHLFSISNLVTAGLNYLRITTGGAVSRTTSSNSIVYNQWNHVAVTWDGSVDSNNVHIYVNGVETSYSDTGTSSGTVDSDAANPLRIGIRGFSDRAFDGKIDEVRIYNRVLSSSEVKQLYLVGR